jgi:hypothetical protein
MPTPRQLLNAGVVNGIFYAVGGTQAGFSPLNTVEAYDPSTDTWSTKAPMPTARAELGVGVVNGILYAIGGAVGDNLASRVDNGILYAVGGGNTQNVLEAFNLR